MLIGFETIIEHIKKNNLDIFGKDIYEFGVCTGNGSTQILKAFLDYGIMFDNYYGFDSWIGLPEETKGLDCPEIWQKGNFNAEENFGMKKEDVVIYLENELKKHTNRPLNFISGFYEDSLTKKLLFEKKLKSALFISIDVDIHKSAYQALDFMARNNLIKKDTIIRYDEWGDFDNPEWKGAKEYEIGESLAHKQITEKYNLEFKTIFHTNSGVKIVILK